MKVDGEMKCEYLIGLVWIVAYVITVTCSTLMPEVLIILALILLFVYYILKNISIISMWIKDWLNGKWIITIMILVIVVFFALWYNGVICIHAIAGYNSNLCSKESAELSYYVVNTISGILTPLLSLGAVIAAFMTLRSQRKQNAIQNFENHLFQMIDQQHKLEEKVVKKYGSFRDLYRYFCVIYADVWTYMIKSKINIVEIKKMKEFSLKISYYIFYFSVDDDLICDKTDERLIEQYGLEKEKLKSLINELKNKLYEKYMAKEKYYKMKIEEKDIYYILFCKQKSEELGIYYRNLFNAIRYIDWECPEEDKKEYYAKLVRTNLSDFAQLMLYYNMQGERGRAWLEKDEVKDPKGDQDGCYSKNNKDGKTVSVKDCLLTRYLPIKNCAISVKKKDIDPRNDGRKELFSDDVIDYELKIEEKTGDN